MDYIKLRIRSGDRDESDRTKRSVIRQIESTLDSKSTNEMLLIYNALANSRNLVPENTGFPYTLPFELI